MKLFIKLIALIGISFFTFSGCAINQPEPKQANTLIQDMSLLKQSPNDKDTLYYIDKDTDFNSYNNLKINPVTILTDLNKKYIDEKLIKDVSEYFNEKLKKEMSPIYKNSGKNLNSLAMSITIVSIEASYDDLKIYQYLPYGLAFTALKRGSGFEKRKIRTSLALKIYDVQTLKTLVLVVDKEDSGDVEDIENISLKNVKPSLDRWAVRYKQRLIELKQGKYKKYLTQE